MLDTIPVTLKTTAVMMLLTLGLGAALAAPAAADDRRVTFRLLNSKTSEVFIDVGDPGPSPGDQLLVEYDVFDRRGTHIGSQQVACTFTGASQVCATNTQLPEGDIETQSPNTFPESFVAAVIGGTGLYRAVRGETEVNFLDAAGDVVEQIYHLILDDD